MGRKPKTIFASKIGDDENLYVLLKYSGINPLIVLTDGIGMTIFKGSRKTYLTVSDVISWFVNEIAYGETHGYPENELKRYKKHKIFFEEHLKQFHDGEMGTI